jgi:hypothetical protein
MSFLHSRRLRYLAAITFVFFAAFVLARTLFLVGWYGLDRAASAERDALLATLGIGVRFDLRLALLVMLPVAAIALLPRWNVATAAPVRWFARAYLVLATAVLLAVYALDFGHYDYLGVRLNGTVLGFAEDAQISRDMLWQSYPLVGIVGAWLAAVAMVAVSLFAIERATLGRHAVRIGAPSRVFGAALACVLVFFGLMGRVSNINPESPYPLRWSDAYFSGDPGLAALGLNPVIYLFDTLRVPAGRGFDMRAVRDVYPVVAHYLGVDEPDADALRYERLIPMQPHRLQIERPPNVVFIMLESLGASRVGAYGTPLGQTPELDAIAADSWFFERFYVPVSGTAKTVWATFTGIPDVSRRTATRNPMIASQRSVLSAFEGYRKLYMIGGSASWANMNALVRQTIPGIELYEEGYWRSPSVDVWGISDLNLFKESNEILRRIPPEQPFFAFVQTAGNHRPFTIPRDSDDFAAVERPLAEIQHYGFRSVEQFNAVRLLDYSVGRFMQMARDGGWFDNTLFVFFGDHNNRITSLPHFPPAYEQLNLESLHVPHMIYAPALLQPRVIAEVVSLVDVLPTIAGLVGLPYLNATMGRDFQLGTPEGERAVPVILREGSHPIYGMLTRDFLVQMNYDGSHPTLHDLASSTPLDDVAALHPEEFERLRTLAFSVYETAHFMLFHNVDRGSPLPSTADVRDAVNPGRR